VVLLFGLANLFADGVSMGLGNFLSVRSNKSLYANIRKKEIEEMHKNTEMEATETRVVLMSKGFSAEDANTLTSIYMKNESYWADFMMQHELNVSDPTDDNPVHTGLATFLSFIFFGFIPLIPFMLFTAYDPQTVFIFSSICGLIALTLLGILKWRITRTPLLSSLGEVVLVGVVAASVAFFVGSLFSI
jgi:VIT1/CCC1 family predicted Fe2+/Mn2+ transporter